MRFAVLALVLFSCEGEEEPEVCAQGDVQTWVVSELTFARRDEGVVKGFDLDGHDSGEGGDEQGCGHPDLVSPQGFPGIDNNFSSVLPLLETTEAVATESLIAQSIASGEFLILLSLDGVDSWQDDTCVDFTMQRGVGNPLVNPQGVILDQQTFALDPVYLPANTETVASSGRIRASDLSFNLPLDVLNAELDFQVTRGTFEVQRRYDGALVGVMGGVIPIAQLTEILGRPDVNLSQFVPVVEAIADIQDADGNCSGLSLAFDFVALPAYLEGDTLPE